MCCFFAALVLVGPRFAILVWWIIDQARWEAAFENFWIALVGWLAVPWTTMGYVIVFPNGVTGFDWIILGFAILMDIASWMGGGRQGIQYSPYYDAR